MGVWRLIVGMVCNRCPSPWLLLDSPVQKLKIEVECFCSLVGEVC